METPARNSANNPSNALPLPSSATVLIVGAGAAGLATAVTLADAGVDFVLIDQLDEPQQTSRATVVHARTLEVLDDLDITDELIANGIEVPRFTIRDGHRKLATITFDHLPTRYRFALMVPQDVTEAVLLAKLRALGGEAHRPYQLTALTNGATGVTATVSDRSGELHEIHAEYLVGADGMHSIVREQAGIGFTGDTYARSFVLADVRMTWPLSRDEVGLTLSPTGYALVAPLPDNRFRVVATVPNAPERPNIADIQAILEARGPKGTIKVTEVVWSSRFRVHRRIADQYRAGRVLLAGDAAHVHSPAGGQGMNTGIQDAVALGRILAKALANDEDAMLDEYQRTRRPIAQGVVSLTDRMTRILTISSAPLRAVRRAVLPLVTRIPRVRRAIAYQLAELANR